MGKALADVVGGVVGICVGTGGQSDVSLLKKVTSATWTQSESRKNCSVMISVDINKPLAHTLTRESQEGLGRTDLTYIPPSDILPA